MIIAGGAWLRFGVERDVGRMHAATRIRVKSVTVSIDFRLD